jgi:hypothetical protein
MKTLGRIASTRRVSSRAIAEQSGTSYDTVQRAWSGDERIAVGTFSRILMATMTALGGEFDLLGATRGIPLQKETEAFQEAHNMVRQALLKLNFPTYPIKRWSRRDRQDAIDGAMWRLADGLGMLAREASANAGGMPGRPTGRGFYLHAI